MIDFNNCNIISIIQISNSYMIEHIRALQEFLKTNKMQSTLQSLRSEIMSKYPQAPSSQLMNMAQQPVMKKKPGKTMELSARTTEKSSINKKKSDRIMQCLLGRIAYSSNILEEQILSQNPTRLNSNKYFNKFLADVSKEYLPTQGTQQENNWETHQYRCQQQFEPPRKQQNIHHFDDQLELIEAPEYNQYSSQVSQINRENNVISKIDLDNSQISIVSQPSFVLEELNKNEYGGEGYVDDNDLGYFEYEFNETQLLSGCSKLTLKYGYPEKAVKKNSKNKLITKQVNKTKKNKKFPDGVMFPNSNDTLYPLEYNGFIYDVLKMRVIFDREKTGYEDTKDLHVNEGDILAGRYRVECILGSGVFAKVIKAFDLIKNELTCLKMISNNKDFFDQALDEIKLLRYINANVDPDKFNILRYKGVFYHKEHLFIETDLLRDNLFVAYRKNPAFFSIPILKEIAKQILIALTALHGLHVIHADLKPENILIKSYNPIQIKVVDLGNSCFFHDHLGQYVQSRSYRAPQVVLGVPYDEKIDIWSVGCILAELWTKNVLFYNNHIQGMLARIQSIVGPWPQWMLDEGQSVQNYFSKQNLIFFAQGSQFHILIPKTTSLKSRIRTEDEEFINFLEGTLKIDPNFRFNAEQALSHPWLQ